MDEELGTLVNADPDITPREAELAAALREILHKMHTVHGDIPWRECSYCGPYVRLLDGEEAESDSANREN